MSQLLTLGQGGTYYGALQSQMAQKPPQTSIDLSGLYPGASSGLQDVLKQLQTAQNQANAANQKRYSDILKMYSGMGQAGAQQIAQQTAQQQAQGTQNLMSRGLGNTTITGTMARGVQQAGQQNLLNLQEGLAGQEAGVMERMTQQGPDISQYLNLIASAAQRQPQQRTLYSPGNWQAAQDVFQQNWGGNTPGYVPSPQQYAGVQTGAQLQGGY